jgi:hypothetical protein
MMNRQTFETDVFLSHNWGDDELQRDNHTRVKLISDFLIAKGLVTWFDEDRITGNINDKMTQGIERTKCIAVFVTKKYFDKVAQADERDNCKLEFQYASRKQGAQRMIPIVMEPGMKNTLDWIGQAGATLGSLLYVDMSGEINATNLEILYTEIQKKLTNPTLNIEHKVFIFSQMSPEYQSSLSSTLESLKPLAVQLHTQLSNLFPDATMSNSFRQKSLDRAAQKDVNDYAGPQSIKSQVLDLFAARISPKPSTIGRDAKEECRDKILDYFQKNSGLLTVDLHIHNKKLRINGRDMNVHCVIFNQHIELQILTLEEYDFLNKSHAQYVVERETIKSKCMFNIFIY